MKVYVILATAYLLGGGIIAAGVARLPPGDRQIAWVGYAVLGIVLAWLAVRTPRVRCPRCGWDTGVFPSRVRRRVFKTSRACHRCQCVMDIYGNEIRGAEGVRLRWCWGLFSVYLIRREDGESNDENSPGAGSAERGK